MNKNDYNIFYISNLGYQYIVIFFNEIILNI